MVACCFGVVSALRTSASSYEGFGATTPGGSGQAIHHVTNLNDSGAGSLREALSQGNRYVVFDVAGEILLSSLIKVTGAFITVDGFSAPSPGITLRYSGIRIFGPDSGSAHDVVIRGLRIREPGVNNTEGDGFDIKYGAYNIVIDHVSVDSCGDGKIDITRGAHDVTVSWSVLSNCGRNMLIKYQAARVSVHHNVFVESAWRNPSVAFTDEFLPNVAPEITADVRNNLFWHWGNPGGGTILQCGCKANIVNNFYSSPNTIPPDRPRRSSTAAVPHLPEAGLFSTLRGTIAPMASPSISTISRPSRPRSMQHPSRPRTRAWARTTRWLAPASSRSTTSISNCSPPSRCRRAALRRRRPRSRLRRMCRRPQPRRSLR